MRDDIETLLRDAGHGPTRDLDVDQVHAAGQRRARTRNVTTGIGALALLGVVSVGVNVLLPDTPEAPIVDQGPSEQEPVPGDGEDAAPESIDGLPVVPATSLGSDVVVLQRAGDDLDLVRVSPDGRVVTAAGLTDGSDVLDAQTLLVDELGNVVVGGPASDQLRVFDPGEGLTFAAGVDMRVDAVLGTDERGRVLLSVLGDDLRPEVVVRGQDQFLPLDRLPASGLGDPGSQVYDADGDLDADRLLFLRADGDETNAYLLAPDSDGLLFSPEPGAFLRHAVMVGDEAWIVLQQADGSTDLVVVDLTDGTTGHVATPVGRTVEGVVTELQATSDGSTLVLSVGVENAEGTPTDDLPAVVVDVAAARELAVEGTSDGVPAGEFGRVPKGVFGRLAPVTGPSVTAPGRVLLLPADVATDVAPEDVAEVEVPELGTTLARVTQDPTAGFEVLLTAPDGATTEFATEPRARDDLAGSVVVDGQGRAVLASAVGDLVRTDADGSTVLAEGDAEAGTPWNVHGTTDEGEVLVSRRDLAGNDVMQLVRGEELVPWPLQPVETSMPEEQFGSATAVGDRLLVTVGVGDSVQWLLYDGDAAPVEVLESSTMPFDDVPSTPALVGDELWHVETLASDDPEGGGPQDLVLRDGDELLRVPMPFGRDLDAFVGAVSVGELADGSPALLLSSVAGDRSGPGPALLVDLDAARAAATTTAGDEVPDGVFFELGEAHLLFVR